MPYIKNEDRKKFKELVKSLAYNVETDGELNYCISLLVHKVLQKRGDINYQGLNNIIGVLECVKLELYSEIVKPYEIVKKSVNGSVSKLDKSKH